MLLSFMTLFLLAAPSAPNTHDFVEEWAFTSMIFLNPHANSYAISYDGSWLETADTISGITSWDLRLRDDSTYLGEISIRSFPRTFESDTSDQHFIATLVSTEATNSPEMKIVRNTYSIHASHDTAITYDYYTDSNFQKAIVAFYPESTLVVRVGYSAPTEITFQRGVRIFRAMAATFMYFGRPIRLAPDGSGVRIEPDIDSIGNK